MTLDQARPVFLEFGAHPMDLKWEFYGTGSTCTVSSCSYKPSEPPHIVMPRLCLSNIKKGIVMCKECLEEMDSPDELRATLCSEVLNGN